jgi:transcription elongation factor Elf1
MYEASDFQVNCPSCNTLLQVQLIQVATQQVITCSNCKKEFRLLDKDGKAKRAISESYPAWNIIR